jgi:signal transduction histidine kinase
MKSHQALSLIAHEIRTPVGVIKGFLELMNDTNISKQEFQEYKKIVDRNCQHLMRLSGDIIDISKIESGKLQIEKAGFSLTDFVNDLQAASAMRAGDKGLAFHLFTSGEMPLSVVSDSTRLHQILTNLIDNAIKFTDKGSIQVTFSWQKDQLLFAVTDTGCGIPEEHLSSLFVPFSQGQYRIGGAGIGLALARRLAQRLGGDLKLECTRVGEGTTFCGFISAATEIEADNISSTKC